MASVLVLACTRETFAVENPTASEGAPAIAAVPRVPLRQTEGEGVETNYWVVAPSLSKLAWRAGEPSAEVTLGVPHRGKCSVAYRKRPGEATTNEMPTVKGEYTAVFTVPPGAGYEGLESTIDFTIAAATSMENGEYYSVYDYAYHAELKITGYTGKVVENLPMLFKIKDSSPVGFKYRDLRSGTDDLRFFDSTGRVLPYEIADWDVAGTSSIWVLVPYVREGTTVTMCWNLRDGCTLPKNDPKQVWADYVGVWHMDEEVDADGARVQTRAADATGHGHDLIPRVGPEGIYDTQTSAEGVFGNARVNDTSARNKRQGSFFEMADSANLAFDGVFTLSFWIKFDAYANYPQLATRRVKSYDYKGFQIDLASEAEKTLTTPRACLIARGDTQKGSYQQVVDKPFKEMGFVHLAFVYNGTNVSIFADGVCKVDKMTIGKASDNGLPITLGNQNGGTDQSVWGKYDEVRLFKGARNADWIAADAMLGTNTSLFTYGTVVADRTSLLKNTWNSEPSISKKTWEAGTYPTWDDFNIDPAHGEPTVVFYDRVTGLEIGTEIPQAVGEYRAVITVPADDGWGALEATVEFRIIVHGGSHSFGDNIDRILLMNDDHTVDGGDVAWQSYSDELVSDDQPYWQHLDEYGENASTTPLDPEFVDEWSDVPDFNLGGGMHHVYWLRGRRLWDLNGVRFGNTFRNGEYGWKYGSEGLSAVQNYLPWNWESQRVIGRVDEVVDGWQRFVGQVVMQNTVGAAVTSACYTNGVGTIYFDVVNGWTDNIFREDGTCNYQIEVQIATNTVPDKYGKTHCPYEEYTSSNPKMGGKAYDAYLYADWKTVPMRVLRFDNREYADLGEHTALDLCIDAGGSTNSFYRVVVPVNARVPGLFRIRRKTVDPICAWNPDGYAFILIDNIICSQPTAVVDLQPYGRFVESKTGKQVIGQEGAFVPPFPSKNDVAVYGRAKPVMPDGTVVGPGLVASAAMHYRWHYLDQKTTGWKVLDLDPMTMRTRQPLELPPFEGDIDFWFDVNQNSQYYKYADYSGTGLYLGGFEYSEEVIAATNRPAGGSWFVRTREAKSDYSELKILVKTSAKGPVSEIDMTVANNRVWRGFYRMKEELPDGILWRIEARDRQTPGDTAWNSSTNRWYVLDWDDTMPKFPAAGRLSEGDTNSWSRMACDMQTGYLMFQVDESSLGVTVIHSDYQDFNSWSDAAKGYFVGAFSDTNAMTHGASPDTRQYGINYKSWPETPATSRDWSLIFDGTIDDPDYPGYKSFSGVEGYFEAWQIGKGMWVYGKYREPSSRVALQMAGCGEGYAEFSNRTILGDNWPRGLEAVSFNARIAQVASPAFAAFYDEGQRLTNYTFLARTCFDMKKNEGFAGNASVSLFAYYRRDKGAYEARWEQIKGTSTSNPLYDTSYLGPAPRGQRLVISRWDKVGDTYQETQLNVITNGTGGFAFNMPVMPVVTGETATNNLMPFCISVFKEGNDTVVMAGVRVTAAAPKAGVRTGVSPTEAIGGKYWQFVCARDKSAKQLKSGSYGVLSANCEGMFLTPQYRAEPAHPADVLPKSLKNGFYTNKEMISGTENFTDCYDDIVDGWWAVNPGREWEFAGETARAAPFGFAHVAPTQTVDVYTAPIGSSKWALLDRVLLTGFGSPAPDPDYKPTFYYANDCVVKLRTGGGLDDYRTDVVISDIEVRQWRGYESWDGQPETYGRTNFVFTSGWVTNGATQLSAKRTAAGTPCSIRSPLMDGYDGRGIGLGSFGITYREPQQNIRLLVQFATNVTYRTIRSLTDEEGAGATGNNSWLTVTNLTYKQLWTERPLNEDGVTKTWETSFGFHGAQGVMRIIVDPTLVREVADVRDTSLFGAIEIVAAACSDEPALDKGCWWGWNMQTIGDANDTQKRMFLPDCTSDLTKRGRSLALNNSITDGVDPAEKPTVVQQHMPFLQSPSFTNAIIGQISFKARKYDLSDLAPDAKVVVYGAEPNKTQDQLARDDGWTFVEEFPITNTIYTTYTCKTDAQSFRALRLAVVDVGTAYRPSQPPPGDAPQRVMIDEVMISEAVRAMLAFRNVGAFRSDLDKNTYVPGVTTKEEQPLCDENWGVQAEVFTTMLDNEIDKTFVPRVKLHWYVGTQPWGFANWRAKESGSAYLAQTEGSNYVYRSSYKEAPGAVMPAQSTPGTVVQYMLEVEYRTINAKASGVSYALATNWLDMASWSTPDWYAPVDYNADRSYGAGKSFAAYTILDKVAPGWAWLNEMNILGTKQSGGGNSDEQFQYVEVCVPAEADLTGWRLRMLEVGIYNDQVVTNDVARFGNGMLKGMKKNNMGMASNKVFRCVGNKVSKDLQYDNGTLDGLWSFSEQTSTFRLRDGVFCIYNTEMPFGVQLVRPSGIIESSAVFIGTNRWGRLPGYRSYDPTNIATRLNQLMPGSKFFYAAEDCRGTFRSASVTAGHGESPEVWANDWACSPGYINTNFNGKVQQIDPNHPTPHGDTIIIYASVDTSFGHIVQRVGEAGSTATNKTEMILLHRGSETGTNIYYTVEPWYELKSVTTNGVNEWAYVPRLRDYKATIGVGVSNNITVVATAQVDSKLREYGLTEDNPYTPAVMDWLVKGVDAYGNPFANPGEIALADYMNMRGAIVTNMTLTSMYWLDMDPTVSNLIFKAGMVKTWPEIENPLEEPVEGYKGQNVLTNTKMRVFMMISNRTDGAAWSPYILRGLDPNFTSWDYDDKSIYAQTWTSVTFKVTGILANGLTVENNKQFWIPLRWFVFHEDSFYQPGNPQGHDPFTTDIEIVDPHSISSPGANAGWYQWCKENHWVPVFNSWSIDSRLQQSSPEVLKPENFLVQ